MSDKEKINTPPDLENDNHSTISSAAEPCTFQGAFTSQNMPKYFPREHELTKWLINQMRRRHGLHHLVNFANAQPFILSANFEVLDQPDQYLEAKNGPMTPAYSNKTILYLTPLAIAVYLGYRSVMQLLLDKSGTRLSARARQNVDVNAICYAKRTKPRTGVFGSDDYFTTSVPILAIRREFYAGLELLIDANFHPQARLSYTEHIGTNEQTTHCLMDALEYALKLLITRPGLDIARVLQVLSYSRDAYDIMAYDVYTAQCGVEKQEIWHSLFRRFCRKGVSAAYSNCGMRIINVLEVIETNGFFRQEHMPRGPLIYDIDVQRAKVRKNQPTRRMFTKEICALQAEEAAAAKLAMAVDRDACFAILTFWLNRMRNRCMAKQAQRLTTLLLSALRDTDMLEYFLFPPQDVDVQNVLWPPFLELEVNTTQAASTHWTSCAEEINTFTEDLLGLPPVLDPIQMHELRQDLAELAFTSSQMKVEAVLPTAFTESRSGDSGDVEEIVEALSKDVLREEPVVRNETKVSSVTTGRQSAALPKKYPLSRLYPATPRRTVNCSNAYLGGRSADSQNVNQNHCNAWSDKLVTLSPAKKAEKCCTTLDQGDSELENEQVYEAPLEVSEPQEEHQQQYGHQNQVHYEVRRQVISSANTRKRQSSQQSRRPMTIRTSSTARMPTSVWNHSVTARRQSAHQKY
ncbi:unnamed protein product [Schistocephalus solidus]|uniref:ANK_REP_REGION domain-containing protein n=1 Tax=Schistocephalus solidus TaxID=70667 RepID=A0A183SSA9_SCHSO|nr:unnamed protein product [Schistocephalus solidus]